MVGVSVLRSAVFDAVFNKEIFILRGPMIREEIIMTVGRMAIRGRMHPLPCGA